MIYSASRRTDLPAAHPDWLAARLSRSRTLDAVVYWTKHPTALVEHPGLVGALERWPSVVQLTVTGLAGTPWEPGTPPLSAWRDDLAELARRLPAGAIQWRFDPIVTPAADLAAARREVKERFLRTLEGVARALGDVDRVTVSFYQPYRHAAARIAAAGLAPRRWSVAERCDLLVELRRAWNAPRGRFGICCHPGWRGLAGIIPAESAACVSAERFDRLYGTRLGPGVKDPGQRPACDCSRSTDIGDYGRACLHGCVYCYAARDAKTSC